MSHIVLKLDTNSRYGKAAALQEDSTASQFRALKPREHALVERLRIRLSRAQYAAYDSGDSFMQANAALQAARRYPPLT